MDLSLKQALEQTYPKDPKQLKRYLEALSLFKELYGTGDVLCFRAPGRVNLIGEHTDYNHGFVMPVALDKDTLLLIRPRQDATIQLHNSEFSYAPASFEISTAIELARVSSWTNYARGVAQVMQQKFAQPLKGFDGLVVAKEPFGVPRSAGLSSSSSLTVVVLLALAHINHWDASVSDLVSAASDAEWYVGTRGGIMDQYISLQGAKNKALFLDCRPAKNATYTTKAVPLPEAYQLLIVNSGVKHQNVGGGYNYRVAACRAAVGLVQKVYPFVSQLRDLEGLKWETFEALLPTSISVKALKEQAIDLTDIPTITPDAELKVKARCRHVYTENQRVLQAMTAMETNNMPALGKLLKEAHTSAKNDYEISCPEIEALVNILNAQQGVLGARLTGAGWGGCVVALVEQRAVKLVVQTLKTSYQEQTKLEPDVFVCEASSGAGLVCKLSV